MNFRIALQPRKPNRPRRPALTCAMALLVLIGAVFHHHAFACERGPGAAPAVVSLHQDSGRASGDPIDHGHAPHAGCVNCPCQIALCAAEGLAADAPVAPAMPVRANPDAPPASSAAAPPFEPPRDGSA